MNDNKVTLFHLLSATAANQNNKAQNQANNNFQEEEVSVLPYTENNDTQDVTVLEESPSVSALFDEQTPVYEATAQAADTELEQPTWEDSRSKANMRVFASNEEVLPVPFESQIVEEEANIGEVAEDEEILNFAQADQLDSNLSNTPVLPLEVTPQFDLATTEEDNSADIEYLDEADKFDTENIDEAYRQRLMALGLEPIETVTSEVVDTATTKDSETISEDIDEALSQVFADPNALAIPATGNVIPDTSATTESPASEHFSPLDFHSDGVTSGVNAPSNTKGINAQVDTKASMLKQFRQLQDRNSTFVFMFGRQQAGKTVLLSSLAYHLGTDENGLLETRRRADNLKGAAYLKQLSESVRKGQFMNRTAVGSLYELDLTYTPNKPEIPMNFTFLEMSGEDLTKVELSETTAGELPSDIEVYLKCPNLNVVFMLVVPYEDAEEHDYLVIDFLDYLKERKPDFDYSKLLLLISKWDRYEGLRKDAVDLFVKEQMPRTYSRLKAKKATLARYSIGEVSEDNEEILELNQERPAVVKRWLYQAATGQKIKDASTSFWNKVKQWV